MPKHRGERAKAPGYGGRLRRSERGQAFGRIQTIFGQNELDQPMECEESNEVRNTGDTVDQQNTEVPSIDTLVADKFRSVARDRLFADLLGSVEDDEYEGKKRGRGQKETRSEKMRKIENVMKALEQKYNEILTFEFINFKPITSFRTWPEQSTQQTSSREERPRRFANSFYFSYVTGYVATFPIYQEDVPYRTGKKRQNTWVRHKAPNNWVQKEARKRLKNLPDFPDELRPPANLLNDFMLKDEFAFVDKLGVRREMTKFFVEKEKEIAETPKGLTLGISLACILLEKEIFIPEDYLKVFDRFTDLMIERQKTEGTYESSGDECSNED